MNWNKKRVIVFGGGGFLGRYIVEQLIELGCESVSIFGRSDYPELSSIGVNVIRGDIRDYNCVDKACNGSDIVFITAAKAGVWGRWDEYYGINVLGTQNIVKACLKYNVRSIIYTSSPSVAYSAEQDIEGMNERSPYPTKYLAHYPKSKALAEQYVLAANCDALKTVALRPHLIWGPRDTHLIPRVLDAARKGKLRIIGDGTNTVDMTYVENAAFAHICAAVALESSGACSNVEGKAYFISDDQPVKLWDWTNNLLKRCGIVGVDKMISYKKAYNIGHVLESIYKIFPFLSEPPMTRFIAGQLAHSHWFDISAAKRDFGYKVIVEPNEGLENLINSLELK